VAASVIIDIAYQQDGVSRLLLAKKRSGLANASHSATRFPRSLPSITSLMAVSRFSDRRKNSFVKAVFFVNTPKAPTRFWGLPRHPRDHRHFIRYFIVLAVPSLCSRTSKSSGECWAGCNHRKRRIAPCWPQNLPSSASQWDARKRSSRSTPHRLCSPGPSTGRSQTLASTITRRISSYPQKH